MSKAYKKINFRDFSGGQGEKFTVSVDPKKFELSNKIEVSILSKKLSAAKKFSAKTESTTADADEQSEHRMLDFNNRIYVFFCDSADKPQLSWLSENSSLTDVYTFANSAEILGFWSHGIYLIVSINDSVLGEVSYYSSDSGASWALLPHFVFSITTRGDYAYVEFHDYGTSTNTIEKTQNFTVFTLVYTVITYKGNEGRLNTIQGYVYAGFDRLERESELIQTIKSPFGGWAKICISKESEIHLIYTEASATLKAGDELAIYRFDGSELKKWATIPFEIGTYPKLNSNIQVKGYRKAVDIISGKVAGEYYVFVSYRDVADNDILVIYKLFESGEYYKIYTSAIGMRYHAAIAARGVLYIQLYDVTNVDFLFDNDYVLKFETAAQVDTPVVDIGEITFKRVTVKHRPLQAGTSVKIYVKYNYATSWTEIINSNTTNSIRKDFNVTAGSKYDNAQFRIELNTTDDTKTAEDVQLEVLYKPIGLENA